MSRAAGGVLLWLCCTLSLTVAQPPYGYTYQTPDVCKSMIVNGVQYFFNITQVQCTPCSQPIAFQTVSSDGLRCACKSGYYLTQDNGGVITCAACPAGQIASFSGWECVVCATNSTGSTCDTCASAGDEITVERQLDGSYTSPFSQTCEVCANMTLPNAQGRQCVRCNQILSVNGGGSCKCDQSTDGVCFSSSTSISLVSTSVAFGSTVVSNSLYFTDNADGAVTMCLTYGNQTACELMGNLCVLLLYSETAPTGSDQASTACTFYKQGSGGAQWPPNMPWLYYSGSPNTILTDTSITTVFQFKPATTLDFVLGTYALNGSFLGYVSVEDGLLQLCKNSVTYMNSAFVFGTYYQQTCTIPAQYFWQTDRYPPLFYDMWLLYTSSSGTQMMYAVPVLITNYVSSTGQSVNTGTDRSQWQLVRRFFLVDNVSGKTASTQASSDTAQAIRFIQSMTIQVEMASSQGDGRIYPPLLTLTYATASLNDYNSNTSKTISFEVNYVMSYNSIYVGSCIAVGVLSAVSLAYAILRTWSWWCRGRRLAVDLFTMLKFILYWSGYVANSLFIVLLGATLWWFIIYKNQGNVQVVLNSSAQYIYVVFLAVGFSLKFLELVHVHFIQATIDIFLIDWERPDTRVLGGGARNVGGVASEKFNEPPVSIWRTYFAANEWNEIQTLRKTSPVFTIITVVFFLEIVGFGNLATAEPSSTWQLNNPNDYYAPMNPMLRFAMIASVFLLTALAEWLFDVIVYERFFDDPLRNYIDFCSLSNISVLVLEGDTFGYYIHGRSPLGKADTNLGGMYENLKREEEDSCARRGLEEGTDYQTYRLALPKKLRNRYDKIVMPIISARNLSNRTGGGVSLSKRLDRKHIEDSVEAYSQVNKLLQDFIDHSLKGVDYVIKERTLLEQLLDVEFQNPEPHMGYFYRDTGRAFDHVLYFGNESTLLIFEILLFALLDLGTNNYFLDGAIVYLVMEDPLLILQKRHLLGYPLEYLVKCRSVESARLKEVWMNETALLTYQYGQMLIDDFSKTKVCSMGVDVYLEKRKSISTRDVSSPAMLSNGLNADQADCVSGKKPVSTQRSKKNKVSRNQNNSLSPNLSDTLNKPKEKGKTNVKHSGGVRKGGEKRSKLGEGSSETEAHKTAAVKKAAMNHGKKLLASAAKRKHQLNLKQQKLSSTTPKKVVRKMSEEQRAQKRIQVANQTRNERGHFVSMNGTVVILDDDDDDDDDDEVLYSLADMSTLQNSVKASQSYTSDTSNDSKTFVLDEYGKHEGGVKRKLKKGMDGKAKRSKLNTDNKVKQDTDADTEISSGYSIKQSPSLIMPTLEKEQSFGNKNRIKLHSNSNKFKRGLPLSPSRLTLTSFLKPSGSGRGMEGGGYGSTMASIAIVAPHSSDARGLNPAAVKRKIVGDGRGGRGEADSTEGSISGTLERRISVRQSENAYRFKEISVRKCSGYVQVLLISQNTRPPSPQNSLTPKVLQELIMVLNHTRYDDSRVLLLSGSGRTFCSGIDLRYLTTAETDRRTAAKLAADSLREFISTLIAYPKPIVAAINGPAEGLGVALLPLCDIVFASDKASFSCPYATLCQTPEGCSSYTFPKTIGMAMANEMLLRGRKITALEAHQIGLISQVLWPDAFMNEVIPRVQSLANQSAKALENSKALIRSGHRSKLEAVNAAESQMLLEHWSSTECQLAIKSYLDNNSLLL